MAADISLSVPSAREVYIRNMLRKHEHIWSGQLEEIKIIEKKIGLVLDAKPIKSPTYRGGQKSRKHENSEIDKQLKTGFIEPGMSE